MFDFFKPKNEPLDVKGIRDGLLQFIKEQLQKVEGGEGGNIRSLHLFLAPGGEDRHLYEAAVYADEEGRFKEEVQKIADDYALELPQNWALEINFAEALPSEAARAKILPAALVLSGRRQPAARAVTSASVKILNGEAEREVYPLTSDGGKVFIGREKKVQTADGFYRENTIAFPGSSHDANRYISRQHAHIEWDEEGGCFLLFADEGGVPPRNKVKVRSRDGALMKLQTTQIGYPLQDGDQVIVGESALLEFRYDPA